MNVTLMGTARTTWKEMPDPVSPQMTFGPSTTSARQRVAPSTVSVFSKETSAPSEYTGAYCQERPEYALFR